MEMTTSPGGRPWFGDDRHACAWIRDFVAHFANPVRLKLLCRLMEGRACVSELMEATGEKQSTVSQQLKHLLLAGLVDRERVGTRVYYEIANPVVPEVMHFLARVASRGGRKGGHESR